jgi:hypothetical protein
MPSLTATASTTEMFSSTVSTAPPIKIVSGAGSLEQDTINISDRNNKITSRTIRILSKAFLDRAY